MSEKQQEFRMTNVQLSEDVREMLSVLKERYNGNTMNDGLRAFIEDVEPELARLGKEVVNRKAALAAKRPVNRQPRS